MNKLKKIGLAIALAVCSCHSVSAETVVLKTPGNHQVMGMSPNGKWACGVIYDLAMNLYGFRWNLESGTIELLSTSGTSLAWTVSNDGVVGGEYTDTEYLPNGASMTLPGYYKDGKWHRMELPAGTSDGMGGYITPDGEYLSGTLLVNGVYRSYIWKDGQIYRQLSNKGNAIVYAISPDGQSAAGWDDGITGNRVASYWKPDGTEEHFTEAPYYSSPWNSCRNFSSDGKKIVYWGGWAPNEDNTENYLYAIYDIQTGEQQKIKVSGIESDAEFFNISNSGMLLGMERDRAIMYVNGECISTEDYLRSRGVNFDNFDDFYSGADYTSSAWPLQTTIAISEDENVMALIYYNHDGLQTSMVVKMDQDMAHRAPAEVTAEQLTGLNTVSINWKLAEGASKGRGFNVYRDGTKLNGMLPIMNATSYYDTKATVGTHEYVVSQVGSDNKETKAEAITVTVKENTPSAPLSLFTRQKGMNDVFVSWKQPLSNLYNKNYYNADDAKLDAIIVYEPVEMEVAVRFDKAELDQYKGGKIKEVSFYPMGEHKTWKVNFYTRDENGTLSLISSQDITQPLKINELNTVAIDNPIDLSDNAIGSQLIVAIQVNVAADEMGSKTVGGDFSGYKSGYSDLMRQLSESDFYSMYTRSVENGMPSAISWAITVGIEPADFSSESNQIDHYTVYADNNKIGETQETAYEISGLADGTHDISVDAVFADGSTSEKKSVTINLQTQYKTIDNVKVDRIEDSAEGKARIKATWQAPVNDDKTNISYATKESSTRGVKGPEDNNYGLMAAAIYTPSMLKGYNGYKINSFRFYPLANALYTIYLYENDKQICEIELEDEDYTVGAWSEIAVPEDITLNENSEYRMVIDAYDPDPDVNVLAVDGSPSRTNYSDLYSLNGEEWNSLVDTGSSSNWMMGFSIVATEQQPMPVEGYDVYIDRFKRNTEKLTTPEFVYEFAQSDDKQHNIRVDAYYTAKSTAVNGKYSLFVLGSSAGIADNMIAEISLRQGDNFLKAEGEGIESITVYSANSAVAASAKGDTVNISSLATGSYIVKIIANGKTTVRKIHISSAI